MDAYDSDCPSPSAQRPNLGVSFLTWQRALGGLLLLAAGLKAAQAADAWLWAAMAEALLGLWLLAGFFPTASHWAACACFMVFLAVSLHKALAGESSCGCFGHLTVNPWLTAGFNVAVVTSLCLAMPKRGLAGRRWLAGAAVLAAVSFGATPHLATVRWSGERGQALDPRLWLGRSLDLSADVWEGRGIDEGNWFVAFYSPACEACRTDFQRLCEAVADEEGERRRASVAIIEVSSSEKEAPPDFTRADARGRLLPGTRFVAPTPLILEVRGGSVVGYARSADIAMR